MNAIGGANGWTPIFQPGAATPQRNGPAQTFEAMLRRDDTVLSWGCEYGKGIFLVLDTGAEGPDEVRIVIHEDGSSTVTVNGVEYEFDREQTRNLRVRVDDGDRVQVDDRRSDLDKALDPNPIQVFDYPR